MSTFVHPMSEFLANFRICLPNVGIYLFFNIDSPLLEVMNFVSENIDQIEEYFNPMLAQKNELMNLIFFSQIKSSIYELLFQFFYQFQGNLSKIITVLNLLCSVLDYSILKKFAMVYTILFLKMCIISFTSLGIDC